MKFKMLVKRMLNMRLLRDAGVYFSFSVGINAVSFFILPLLSHFLLPRDFGIIGIFMVYYQLIGPVMGLSMNSIIARSFYTREDISDLVGSAMIFSVFSLLLFSSAAFVLPQPVYDLIGLDKPLIFLMLIAACAGLNGDVFSTILQMQKKPFYWGLWAGFALVANIGITFGLIMFFNMTYLARIIAIFVSALVSMSIGFYLVKKHFNIFFTVNYDHYRYFIKLGVPLVIVAFSGWGMMSVDRIFIQKLIGLEYVGYFVMAGSLSSIMRIIETSFSRAWAPFAYENLARKNYLGLLKMVLVVFAAFLVIAVFISTVGVYVFRLLINQRYYYSLPLVPIIVAGMTFNALYGLFVPFILHLEETRVLSAITFLSVISNIVLDFVLIRMFGLYGAAVAGALAYLTLTTMAIVFIYRRYKLPLFFNIMAVKS